MTSSKDFKRLTPYLYEAPKSHRPDMRVPARFYADAELLEAIKDDKSLDQLANTATLPGVVKYALAMPDIHQGYGFPIGGVIATELPDGVISPGGVGYDINCGVRLLGTHLFQDEVEPYLDDLASTLNANCPSGVGRSGTVKAGAAPGGELDQLVEEGARWALKKGYATPEDLERTEERGRIEGADATKVSQRAKQRGADQIGTLGAGNHFIEVDVVDEVFDEEAADRMGLAPGRVVVQIHCGSRGYGHQVCTDYVKRFQEVIHKYGIRLPDRELVCAPLSSPEGQDYLGAMKAAANYAFVNRQVLTFHIRRSFEQALAGKVHNHWVYQIYDIAHNMAKVEEHEIDGRKVKVCVHRKGATRAFGPGSPVLPDVYRDIGQPVLVPGSMGTASWVLLGTQGSMEQTFGSTCHGAGRTMSRAQAKRTVRGDELRDELEASGIRVRAGSMPGLAEEAPVAYKNVDKVVEIVHGAGIAKKVARIVPIAVIKG
ncbi:MAG: RtcB family protein [Chloroflexi bacterium]|nr:RtcB family protein [Chloroflexota bacterium]MCI0648408.1 RtcB family protein [Chloroflexota bacterium]MCI0727644.1 RtcB family protein [Chloroflexota bacterium]